MKTTKAIIFDLDGTLADSTGCIVNAAHFLCDTLNLKKTTDEAIRSKIGQPLGPMLASLFNIEGKLLDKAVLEYSREYVRRAATDERLFPDSISLINTLKSQGFLLAIATGKSQHGAERSTERLGLKPLFDSIHGILPGTPGKPDPAVLRRAMSALGVKASECIMVGDTTFDLQLAHAVGVRTAAVNWGVHPKSQLLPCNPDFYAETFDDLKQWLLAQ